MSPNGMRSDGSEDRCERLGGAERIGSDITDAAVVASITPRPAEAVVEHLERLSRCQFANDRDFIGRQITKRGRLSDYSPQRLSIVGRDHSTCECDVGKILPICIEVRVRWVERAGKGEFFSGGGRRPRLGR
jgi:hypothetical protein